MRSLAFNLALAAAALSACSKPPPKEDPALVAARAAQMAPADARLADLYAHACKACHAQPASGAPLAGDKAAWAPRLAKGDTALMTSVTQGFKGMPPGGQCFACTADDYRRLVRFMSGQGG